jgi:hypothetical protein
MDVSFRIHTEHHFLVGAGRHTERSVELEALKRHRLDHVQIQRGIVERVRAFLQRAAQARCGGVHKFGPERISVAQLVAQIVNGRFGQGNTVFTLLRALFRRNAQIHWSFHVLGHVQGTGQYELVDMAIGMIGSSEFGNVVAIRTVGELVQPEFFVTLLLPKVT